MNRRIISPSTIVLDEYEAELERALEKRSKRESLDEKEKMQWAEAAKKHTELQRSKRITLSVNSGELLRFKAKAKSKNIPYQTLINVILRQYNDGDIQIGL